MRYVAGIYRLAIAFFCITGTMETWTLQKPANFVYFTHQTNILLGLLMIWAGVASLTGRRQPPAWLKGMLTLNIAITGVIAAAILPPTDPADYVYAPWAPGIPLITMLHVIAPIMAVIDFLVFDEHRRYKWSYAAWWLIYFPVYLAFVLIRGYIWPASGPEDDGSPFPYPFLDLPDIGWRQMCINIVVYMTGFLLAGLLLCAIDRALPARTPLTGCLPGTSGDSVVASAHRADGTVPGRRKGAEGSAAGAKEARDTRESVGSGESGR